MSTVKQADVAQGLKADSYEYLMEADAYSDVKSIYKDLVEVKQTDKAYEMSTSVVEDSDPVERGSTEAMVPVKPIEGYTTLARVRNFYKMIEVAAEVAEDHQKFKPFMTEVTKKWDTAMKRGKNKFVVNHFNYGGYTAGHDLFYQGLTGVLHDPNGGFVYDGKPLFNLSGNERTSIAGGKYYNAIAKNLDATNFEELWKLMTVDNARNEDDTEIEIRPDTLLVNSALDFPARRLLESTLIPGKADNDKNVLEGIVDLVATPYFTPKTGWVLMEAKKGLTLYERRTPVIDSWFDHSRKVYFVSIEERYGLMVKNFRFVGGSNIPTS